MCFLEYIGTFFPISLEEGTRSPSFTSFWDKWARLILRLEGVGEEEEEEEEEREEEEEKEDDDDEDDDDDDDDDADDDDCLSLLPLSPLREEDM